MNTKIRLDGVAYRAASSPDDSSSWNVPEQVPLTVDFGPPIGRAELAKQDDGSITAVCHVIDNAAPILRSHRYLAISYLRGDSESPTSVLSVAVTDCNSDAKQPPYRITCSPEVAKMLEGPARPTANDPQEDPPCDFAE